MYSVAHHSVTGARETWALKIYVQTPKLLSFDLGHVTYKKVFSKNDSVEPCFSAQK